MQFVILCAGNGTRMEPLTSKQKDDHSMSKVMIPIANSPAIEWTLEKINGDVIIVANKNQQDLIEFAQSHELKIVYQEKHSGTADAILAAEDCLAAKGGGSFFDNEFVCINGDESFDRKEIKKFSNQPAYTIGVSRVDNPEKFGIWSIEDDKLTGIEEKSKSPKSNLANAGLYKLDKKIFDYIRKTPVNKARKEKEITDTFNLMIKNGVEFKHFTVETWKTLSYPWHILEMNKRVLDEHGNMIGKNVEIRPGAYIEEPVSIGDNSIIGPNCFVRKYSSIGKNCRIGNAVEIKNSIIMDYSYVNHLSYVGDTIIGKNCNIGAGTIFANLRLDDKPIKMNIKGDRIDSGLRKIGGIVGHNVKFGVNITVMPGKKIWNDLMIPACILIDNDIEKQPRLK